MFKRSISSRRIHALSGKAMENLESRTMLDSAAYPTIQDLEDPNHTVVRIETNFGDIDLEMLDNVAPLTVANFLKYVRDGDYDRTFFHRLDDDFVLQGGLARLQPGDSGTFGVKDIPIDVPVTNEFSRSNIPRTVAMARRSGVVNSATSQFFFNIGNNTFLDTTDQGFTVFARVVNDRSWQVIQDINALNTQDLGSPYNELPVTSTFNQSDGVSESELVMIWDAEIIKPQGVAAFYSFKYYYPEGFAGSTINEFLPIGNPNGNTAYYQVIVRSERAQTQPAATPGDTADPDFWYRDKVAKTGTIGGNRRGGITMSTFATGDTDLVEQGVPYAIEVWSTSRLSANISHYDFGSATGEAFSPDTATRWALTDLRKGTNIRDFIVWENASDTDTTITVTFYFQSASPFVFTRNTQAFRRGGLSLNDIPQIPDGNFSAVIEASQPLVVASSHYFNNGGSADTDNAGSATLGQIGSGQRVGIVSLANTGTEINSTITFLNTGTVAAPITLILSFGDNTPDITVTPGALIIATGRRGQYDLSQVAGVNGRNFSLRYSAGTAQVYAHITHNERGDDLSQPFAFNAATRHDFAEGFMDHNRAGVDVFETISIYNPNITALGGGDEPASITIRFMYTDGFVVSKAFTLDANGRLDVQVHELAEILAESENNGRFFFSIEVASDIPVVAMMRHFDLTLGNAQPSGGFSTIGIQRNTTPLTGIGG